jgi:glycosyltransferase involved in cell wall biosynthesis
VIVDTGSTDGTQEIIKAFMKDIPGELHQSSWVNFEHNRNEALSFAKGKADYILFIDADEVLSFDKNFSFPELTKDFYHILSEFGGMLYPRVGLVKDGLDWKWKGVVHEAIDTLQAKTCETLKHIKNIVHTDGARSKDPKKFYKDAQVLEKALEQEPNNTRYQFYLAQSYRDAQMPELAIKHYEKRVAMGGWDQEVFWSLFEIGNLQARLGKTEEAVTSYLKSYLYRPTRAEPLYELAHYYRCKGDHFSGYLAAKQGLMLPLSEDAIFVQKWMYDWGLYLEFSICAYWLGKYQDAQIASYFILAKNIPENVRECVNKNLSFINPKVVPKPALMGDKKDAASEGSFFKPQTFQVQLPATKK